MADAEETVANSVIEQPPGAWATWLDLDRSQRRRIIGLTGSAGLLTLLFVQPLARILDLALQNNLNSYIPLVPVISGYLLYIQPRKDIAFRSSVAAAIRVSAIGIVAIGAAIGGGLSANDNLSLMMLAYVSFIVATGFVCLGSECMRTAAFPVAFLVFMVPLPDAAVNWLEVALVAASADAAAWMFRVTGTPMFREGTILTLPGIVLEVARECSGIRSTVVLFITSVLASNLFLRSTSRRVALVALVIPLAIVRNGFRILVIGLLCVHIGPHMTDSFIHHRGGPIFFALSLIPLSLILFWLRRHDRRVNARP
jgi:exosortase C (VPDSG-CTERM-specific)